MNSYERIYSFLIETMTPASHKIVKAQKGMSPEKIRTMNRLMTTKTEKGKWRSLDQAKQEAQK